ncbi:predicted protein [Histoplasma capsulatum G186AR]|uniref:Uncharacterized protein n=1 Tax=Ajellomyces capsulatus (strain G186AR / H82 / ATCC MYA-2454 / RMSCC 2432) TaxID=447093 RepID=C0NSH6_AJECG|nr:uncharacterized protein HCBG_06106 [Histoplasma capsulatum G186AR]EEH05842.1 predicted protein [Histoplasma capsulatum G186AR]
MMPVALTMRTSKETWLNFIVGTSHTVILVKEPIPPPLRCARIAQVFDSFSSASFFAVSRSSNCMPHSTAQYQRVYLQGVEKTVEIEHNWKQSSWSDIQI